MIAGLKEMCVYCAALREAVFHFHFHFHFYVA